MPRDDEVLNQKYGWTGGRTVEHAPANASEPDGHRRERLERRHEPRGERVAGDLARDHEHPELPVPSRGVHHPTVRERAREGPG